MLLALTCGALLATGHHLFYLSLAGEVAPTGSYNLAGATVSKQQFNTAAGTAFAFLVKAMLALAVTVAYTQTFWRALQVSHKGLKLPSIDTMHGVLANAADLFKVHVWWKRPLLLLLAIIAWYMSWCIPVASIVTPSTLSVESALVQPAPLIPAHVPKFDFVNLNFLAGMRGSGPSNENYTQYCYEGPGQLVQRIASAVAAQGQILPISPPASNTSWTLDYSGPALQCSNVIGQQRTAIWDNIFEYLNNATRCRNSPGYLSWVEISQTAPYPFAYSNGSMRLADSSLSSGIPTALWVATIPEMFTSILMGDELYPGACMMQVQFGRAKNVSDTMGYKKTAEATYFGNATLLRCTALNASQTASFDYTNGFQHVDSKLTNATEVEPVVPVSCVTGPADLYQGPNSHYTQAMADWSLANLNNGSCSTLNMIGQQCVFQPDLAKLLSYQAITDAFNRKIIGSIGLGDGTTTVPTLTTTSAITESILMDTAELDFVARWRFGSTLDPNSVGLDLQSMVQAGRGTLMSGLVSTNTTGTRGNLQKTLEELFQNITLSLLSEQYLQANASSPYASPALINVALQTYRNTYVYSRTTLWIAYGLALLFAALAVTIGLASILLMGSAFENTFSTIVRVGRISMVTEDIDECDGRGTAPLPGHLRKARMVMDENGPTLIQEVVKCK
ncbi:hypothetical protein LTR78_005049 [Recurvomyces mirabilis]|uniref:Uncharacterized protein n=1 Tax=Recurvomyces mirabilis TaxID=574656 RepID=A0AAE0WNL1_9PEZI|nr:hypothetical protein LTR78_005049 [Recurvomyces mirabilis]KAK5158335.1 hypothetical protein LTS14_003353 [Recurvomyces mirabilis]